MRKLGNLKQAILEKIEIIRGVTTHEDVIDSINNIVDNIPVLVDDKIAEEKPIINIGTISTTEDDSEVGGNVIVNDNVYTINLVIPAGSGGGGGGGGSSTTQLDWPAYYGASDNEITTASQVQSLRVSTVTPMSGNENKPYFYVAMHNKYTLRRVVTANNENILGNFTLKNSSLDMVIDGQQLTYKLYEFHLSSGLALNESISISIS